jgi:hypothetical protein
VGLCAANASQNQWSDFGSDCLDTIEKRNPLGSPSASNGLASPEAHV